MPITIDMSTAQPIQAAAPVTLDMSTAEPLSNTSAAPKQPYRSGQDKWGSYTTPIDAVDEVGDMIGESVKKLAKVSGPNIIYETLRKTFPQLGLKPVLGMPTANEVGAAGVSMMIPGAEGEGEIGAPETAAEATPKVAPKAAPSLLEHPAVTPWIDSMKRELMKIPFADLTKTAVESAKGLVKGVEPPPAPPVVPPPVPTTNGVPWGSKIPPTGPPELWGKTIPAEMPAAQAAPVTPEAAPQAAANPAPDAASRSMNLEGPRTLSGESALRKILTGQDNGNLLKIAKSRGIDVTQESQLKAGVADGKLINKIIDDFSDDELEGMRSQFIENTRMGKHQFGDIGPEAWKTMGLQSYFPDVKIPAATLRRTQNAISGATAAATPQTPVAAAPKTLSDLTAPTEGDLTSLLQKSLDQAKKPKKALSNLGTTQ